MAAEQIRLRSVLQSVQVLSSTDIRRLSELAGRLEEQPDGGERCDASSASKPLKRCANSIPYL